MENKIYNKIIHEMIKQCSIPQTLNDVSRYSNPSNSHIKEIMEKNK